MNILKIDRLAHGGNGVGFFNGKAVFVPLTAPGDTVSFHPVREKKRYCIGSLDRVLEPSVFRREPPCPYFGCCGGCQWQHLEYPQQVSVKGSLVSDFFKRSHLVDDFSFDPALPSPDEWNYRSRVQFKCRMTDDGFVAGFFRPGTHDVVDIARCAIASPVINALLTLIRDRMGESPDPDRIFQIDVSVGDDDHPRMVVHYRGDQHKAVRLWLLDFGQGEGVSVFLQSGKSRPLRHVWGEEVVNIHVAGSRELTLGYRPGGFAQINLAQNRHLVRQVLEYAELKGHERVLDLCCGMGNITLPIALDSRHCVGVEDFAPSIDMARFNARQNDIDNVDFHVASADQWVRETDETFDLVLMDPPRDGAFSVCESLGRMSPERIIYISCDPATLVRDLQSLVASGYRIVRARALDMFPQTFHVESVTLLERN